MEPVQKPASAAGGEVVFGDFRLYLARRTLTRNGATVLLKGRPLDVLCVLAEARGETVSKDMLLARVWPNAVVEENNLQVHISALRRELDQGSAQTLVVTVPGRGYRLMIGMTGRRRDDHAPRE